MLLLFSQNLTVNTGYRIPVGVYTLSSATARYGVRHMSACIEETVFTDKDNAIALSLLSDGIAIRHHKLTRCQVLVGGTLVDSATAPEAFDITDPDYIILRFGGLGLPSGRYACQIVVYDSYTLGGVVWGRFVITVK